MFVMKKILSLFAIVAGICFFVSCSKNTPKSVTEKFVSALKDKEYSKAIDMCQFSDSMDEQKKQELVGFMEQKVSKSFEKKGGISDFSIDGEEVAEDGNTAKVTYTLKFGNGETSQETTNLVKVDDEWKIDGGK